jgi:archaellum component FlaC
VGRLYNETMGKHLAEKYNHLDNQFNKMVQDANSEIESLQNKIKGIAVLRLG